MHTFQEQRTGVKQVKTNHPDHERAVVGFCNAIDALDDLLDQVARHPSYCDCGHCEDYDDFTAIRGTALLALMFLTHSVYAFPALTAWEDRQRERRRREVAQREETHADKQLVAVHA